MSNRLIEIKKWMLDKGIRQIDIANKAGVKGPSVYYFCKGYMSSKKIKQVFMELGCPEQLLEMKVA